MVQSSYLKYIFDKYKMQAVRSRKGKYRVSVTRKGINFYSEEDSISVAILKLCYLIDTREAGVPFDFV